MSLTATELYEEFISTYEQAAENDMPQLVEQLDTRLSEAALGGNLTLADMDFEELFDLAAEGSDEVGEFFQGLHGMGRRRGSIHERHRIAEGIMDVIKSDPFKCLLSTTIRVGAMEQKGTEAEFGLIDCIDEVNVGCGLVVDTDLPRIPDLADESCEEETTQFYGLDTPDKWTIPERSKRKFAFGITREFLCYDPNRALRRIMQGGAMALDLRKEKLIADALGNLYPIGKNGRPQVVVPYSMNGREWSPYQFFGAGGPHENYMEGQPGAPGQDGTLFPELSMCNTDLLCTVEEIDECRLDPKTCEPLDFGLERSILVGSPKMKKYAEMMISGGSMEMANKSVDGQACGQRDTKTFGPREGWNQDIKCSKYLMWRLIWWYQDNCGSTLEEAKALARQFVVTGDFRRALGWANEWARETLERVGPDTWEYFNQEIVWSIKFMEKSGLYWKRPDCIQIYKPIPEGK